MQIRFISLMVFLFGVNLSAQEPRIVSADFKNCIAMSEICGNGVDDDCDGVDSACPGTDSDNDGQVDSQDCDPNNHFIYPGVSVECSAGCGTGYKTCGSTGSYGTCSCAALCEAKGTGRCFYIDPVAGNDSNAGTFQQKLKTLRRFGSYYNGTAAPSNRIDLRAGDVIYLFSGVYKDEYTSDSTIQLLRIAGLRGTASAPVVFKAYPGNFPVLSPANHARGITVLSSSYLAFDGLQIKEAFEMGIGVFESDHISMSNLNIYDTDGTDNDNMAGLYIAFVSNFELKNSILHDNYDRTCQDTGGNKTENSRNMVLFKGGNAKIHHSTFYQSQPTTAQKTGGCLVYKHSQVVPGGLFEVYNNSFRNCFFTAIGNGGYGGRVHHNLIMDSDTAFMSKDMGGGGDGRDNLVEYNTIINSEAIQFNPSQFINSNYPVGTLEFRNNILSDNRTYGTDRGGALTIDVYGSDAIRQTTISSGYFRASNNSYYSSTGDVSIAFFSSNSSPERSLGALLSFSEWQGMGYDAGSRKVNCEISSPTYKSNVAQCAGRGYLP